MRQSFTILFFNLWIGVSFASAGKKKKYVIVQVFSRLGYCFNQYETQRNASQTKCRIEPTKIDSCWIQSSFAIGTGIIDSFLLGLHSVSAITAIINGQQQLSSQSIPADQTGNYNATGYARTNSSSVFVPTADGGQLRVGTSLFCNWTRLKRSLISSNWRADLCEGDIVVPLSFDVQKEMVIKSTHFPFKRSTPLICSWNVRVSCTSRNTFHCRVAFNRQRSCRRPPTAVVD